MTTEKATNYLVNKGELSKACAIYFPPKIEYKPGKTITKRDTLTIPGDSVPCPPVIQGKDTIYQKIKCPDSKRYTDTVFRTDTITIERTDILDATRRDFDKVNEAYIKQGDQLKQAKNAKWWYLGLGFLLGFMFWIVLKLYFKI